MINNKKLIIIDPGHGGKDSGATNSTDKTHEKDITLAVALLMKPKLIALGYEVKLTREIDVYMTPDAKGAFSNKFNSDFCLSIHCNSSLDKKVTGHEDFYYYYADKKNNRVYVSKEGMKAAKLINQTWMKYFPESKNRNVKGANFALVRIPKCASVLTELDFISNDKWTINYAKSNAMKDKMATALVEGINNYLTQV